MNDYAFSVKNRHTPSCGAPPNIEFDKDYSSYFENSYGEQWIFIADNTGCWVYCGDLGWENKYKVVENKSDLAMNTAEQLWLTACWMAACKINTIPRFVGLERITK